MSRKVRDMFSSIAGRYDLMNEVLSLGIHRWWRYKTVALSSAALNHKVLDCASGTGDLAIRFKKIVGSSGSVTATDFCEDMLELAKEKFARKKFDISVAVQDAMNLTYDDDKFDISSIAFGIRNVDDPKKGIDEMARVVKPGGEVVVLEFGQPYGWFAHIYKFYSKYLIPMLGSLLADSESAYNYLQDTASKFPCRDEFADIMKSTGRFDSVKYYPLTYGVAYIYIGRVK